MLLVERDHVVGELLAAGREHARHRGVAAEEARHMVGRAAHQAEGRLRPGLREQPPGAQVGMRPRDLIGAQHRRAGLGRRERHPLAVFRRRRDVVEARERARRLAEGRMPVTSATASPSTKTCRPSCSDRRYSAPVRNDVPPCSAGDLRSVHASPIAPSALGSDIRQSRWGKQARCRLGRRNDVTYRDLRDFIDGG